MDCMVTLTFYKQVRQDGGIRAGIQLDGEALLERFEPGIGDSDSALAWYIDVRCEMNDAPSEPTAARRWFLDQANVFREQLLKLSQEVRAGIDTDIFPLVRAFHVAGVPGEIVCSSTKRVSALRLSEEMSRLASDWVRQVESLQPAYAPAS